MRLEEVWRAWGRPRGVVVVVSTGEEGSCFGLLGGDVWEFVVLVLVVFSGLIFSGLGCCSWLSFLILLDSGLESLFSTLSLLAGRLRALLFTLTMVFGSVA